MHNVPLFTYIVLTKATHQVFCKIVKGSQYVVSQLPILVSTLWGSLQPKERDFFLPKSENERPQNTCECEVDHI